MVRKFIWLLVLVLGFIIIGELILYYTYSTQLSNLESTTSSIIIKPTPTETPEELAKKKSIKNYIEELLPRLQRNNVIKSNTQEGSIVTTVYESTILSLDLPASQEEIDIRDDWSFTLKVGEEKPVIFFIGKSGFSQIKVYEKIEESVSPISFFDLKPGDHVTYTVTIDTSKSEDEAFVEGALVRNN